MAKFLILWETEFGRLSTDPNEQAAVLGKMMEMTKQAMDKGDITDWGIYAGGAAGYGIAEGTAVDALRGAMLFMPYVKFQVHPVLSMGEVAELMKSMTG
jgi:hypothetical protein